MIRDPISNRLRFFLGFLSIVMLVAAYFYLSHRQHVKNPDDTTIPSLSQLKDGIRKITTPNRRSKEIWLLEDLKATGMRLALGLSVGIIFGVILGLVMGCFAAGEALLFFLMSFASKLNPMAM